MFEEHSPPPEDDALPRFGDSAFRVVALAGTILGVVGTAFFTLVAVVIEGWVDEGTSDDALIEWLIAMGASAAVAGMVGALGLGVGVRRLTTYGVAAQALVIAAFTAGALITGADSADAGWILGSLGLLLAFDASLLIWLRTVV